jgi:predicted secreted Zn-dependent protease
MTDTDKSVDKLVAVYIKIRDKIRETEDRHKEEIAELKEQFDVVANNLLDLCNEQNMDSIRTSAGTVTRRVSSRYWTSDWDSMYQFIQEQDAPYLLEQRIHNSNMRQFLEENPDLCPMGLQADRKYTVQVRKPTSK